jgi:hypothetical protein
MQRQCKTSEWTKRRLKTLFNKNQKKNRNNGHCFDKKENESCFKNPKDSNSTPFFPSNMVPTNIGLGRAIRVVLVSIRMGDPDFGLVSIWIHCLGKV